MAKVFYPTNPLCFLLHLREDTRDLQGPSRSEADAEPEQHVDPVALTMVLATAVPAFAAPAACYCVNNADPTNHESERPAPPFSAP